MKTRREFFKTLVGSCAVLAACVVAPKSLMAASKPTNYTAQWNQIEPEYNRVAKYEDGNWTTATQAEAELGTDDLPWFTVDKLGNWRKV